MAAAAAWIEIAPLAPVLAASPAAPSDWLSASEQARLAGLHHPGRRRQYLAGHWLARVLLARACGGEPARWRLLERRGQAPAVQDHGGPWQLSISHGDDWVAAAVAEVAIGIDLEQRPRRLDPALEPLLLNADEAPGSVGADDLLQRWVAKEAWIKRGQGSALPGRLEHLQLQAVAHERADVRIDSHPAFHFALAIAPGSRVQRRCEQALSPGAAFVVLDRSTDPTRC